ncbi:hypothetical protein HORIV_20650 [Vreelandella olivaria]|uniref:Uncharacterized protein n=1 Tax=Vreelandella olivaria TaxID=390919 RepID=A0ABM7GGD0_9GAMM|nr:hypothetical protein HORIV_20650 [Halomonas olivaria]
MLWEVTSAGEQMYPAGSLKGRELKLPPTKGRYQAGSLLWEAASAGEGATGTPSSDETGSLNSRELKLPHNCLPHTQ